MTTTNKADDLRDALKTAGYKRNQVSVKYPHSTLEVTVRDASIPLSAIRAIAAPFENVRYCPASGEILAGGNTWVDVKYARGLLDARVEAVAAQLRELGAMQPGIASIVCGVATVVRYDGAWWIASTLESIAPNDRPMFVRCDTSRTNPDVDYFRHAARQLVENEIELQAAELASKSVPESPVLAPSNCRPLEPFPINVIPFPSPVLVEVEHEVAPAAECEDWARGL